jgi:hypothetical protein
VSERRARTLDELYDWAWAEAKAHPSIDYETKLPVEPDSYDALEYLARRCADAEATLERLQRLVDEQAEDAGLWFVAQTAPEAYLQQELRRLHREIEGSTDG